MADGGRPQPALAAAGQVQGGGTEQLLRNVDEIALGHVRQADELDGIVQLRVGVFGMNPDPTQLPHRAGLRGARDDEVQVGVGHQHIGQGAGGVRAGAGEFHSHRHTHALGIAQVVRGLGAGMQVQTDAGVEAAVAVVATERAAEPVGHIDVGAFVAPAGREVEPGRGRQAVGEVHAAVAVAHPKAHRTLVERADSHGVALRREGGGLLDLGEVHRLVVHAHPQAGVVAQAEQWVVVMQGQAQASALLLQAIEDVVGHRVAQRGCVAVIVAIDVAVETALVAVAQIQLRGKLPVRTQALGVAEVEKIELVVDVVRCGVDGRGGVHPLLG